MAEAQENKITENETVSETNAKVDAPLNEPSAKKKRTAGRQITKDDGDESDSSTEVLKSGSFQKADSEVLKKRRILRVRDPTSYLVSNKSTVTPTPTSKQADASVDEKKDVDGSEKEGSEKDITKKNEKESTEKLENNAEKEDKEKNGSKDSTSEEKEKSKVSNPFAAVSFSSAVGTNPFSTAFAKSKTDGVFKSSSSGFGSFAGSTVFGSSFGNSSGFGSQKDAPKKPLFGSSSSGMLFGQSTKSAFGTTTGFASAPANASAPTITKKGSNTSSFFDSKSRNTTPFGLSQKEEKDDNVSGDKKDIDHAHSNDQEKSFALSNGEEGFESIFQTRAKLFKRMPVEKKKVNSEEKATGVTQSVPPSASSNIGSQSVPPTSDGIKREEKTKENNASNSDHQNTPFETKMDWKEVGIGPLRILKSVVDDNKSIDDSSKKKDEDGSSSESANNTTVNKVRLVQRRESSIGGHGTKLILNLSLRLECQVHRQAEKYVRLAAFEIKNGIDIGIKESESDEKKNDSHEIVPVNYLFRVKTTAEADDLENILKDSIRVCS